MEKFHITNASMEAMKMICISDWLLYQFLNKECPIILINLSMKPRMNFTVLEIYPEDTTAKLFLGKTSNYINIGIPENWTGVEEMHNK